MVWFFHTETLRKYPPFTFIRRKCTKSTKLRGTDVTVDKGTQIMVPVLGLHRDPKYYPDPERFDPERFSEEEKKKRPHFCYLPFGEGPRICIGKCHLSSLYNSCGPVHIMTILRDGRLINRGLIPGRSRDFPVLHVTSTALGLTHTTIRRRISYWGDRARA